MHYEKIRATLMTPSLPSSLISLPPAPAIILVEPQLGENIGMAARAMGNCGLSDLRLVNPRDGWPNEMAIRASAGAEFILDKVKVFTTFSEAIADLTYVAATTARPRRLEKHVFTAKEMAPHLLEKTDQKTGIVFGPEKYGLSNDHISLCNAAIKIPTMEEFSSLNLAQTVLICAYEWYQAIQTSSLLSFKNREGKLATHTDINLFLEHLESALDHAQFFRPAHKKKRMVHNLRSIFQRLDLTEQEVRTLRGVIRALENPPPTSA